MQDKTLFIHIGTGKTGTSAIQEFLFSNAEALKDCGIAYCKSGLVDINHRLLCRNYSRETGLDDQITSHLFSLANEIQTSDAHKFIVSSEYFPGLTPAEISELGMLLEDICEIQTVVYFRRQDQYVESWYNQIVKAKNSTMTIHELRDRLVDVGLLDYRMLITEWESISSSVHVRPYEKSQFTGGNVVGDFMSILGVQDLSGFIELGKKANLSLSVEQVELKRALDRFASDEVRGIISKPFEFHFNSAKYFMSREDRQALIDKYRAMNELIAEEYLGRNYLFEDNVAEFGGGSLDLLKSRYLFYLLAYLKKQGVSRGLEDALVRYLKSESERGGPEAVEYLFLAHFMRPEGPDIKAKLNALV